MWGFRKLKKRVRRVSSVTKHYAEHKELARELVLARLHYFNQHYGLEWKRVAIRNQRRCWGSCSSLKNLNFNYKILFLPEHLRDYIIVHELCHLVHLNHRQNFWDLVAEKIPTCLFNARELRRIDKGGNSVSHLLTIKEQYHSGDRELLLPASEEVPGSPWSCGTCGQSVVCNCNLMLS